MVKVEFKTDNAAFNVDAEDRYERDYYRNLEIKRVFQNIVNQIVNGKTDGYCIDINGNRIGRWELN
jgi:hypothetical protein